MTRLRYTVLVALVLGTFLVLPVAAQNYVWGAINGIPFASGFYVADGSASAPSMANTGDSNTGIFFPFADYVGIAASGTHAASVNASGLEVGLAQYIAWANVAAGAGPSLTLSYTANNRLDLSTGDSFYLVGGFVGYGAQSATLDGVTTLALTSGRLILNCTGAETIQTITGGLAGMTLIIEHGDTECTLDDDDTPTAADAIDLVGTATDVGAVNKIIGLYYNGTHWLEMWESDN